LPDDGFSESQNMFQEFKYVKELRFDGQRVCASLLINALMHWNVILILEF
jgi:hypothetical protein